MTVVSLEKAARLAEVGGPKTKNMKAISNSFCLDVCLAWLVMFAKQMNLNAPRFAQEPEFGVVK